MVTLVRFYAAVRGITYCRQLQLAASHRNGAIVVTAQTYHNHGKTGCFAIRHFSSASNNESALRRAWGEFLSIVRSFTRGFRDILGDVKKLRPIKTRMGGFQISSTAPNLSNVQITSQELRFMEEVSV